MIDLLGAAAAQGRRRAQGGGEPPWSPTALPGVIGIYECDDSSNTLDESSRLVTWHDQSSYGNHLGTANEAARPSYGGATEGVVFDGSAHYLRALSTATVGSQPAAVSIILVAQLLTAGATTVHARWLNASGTDRISLGATGGGAPRFLTSGTGGAASTGTSLLTSSPQLYWGRVTLASSQSCGVGTTAESTTSITATYADLDGGRFSLAANSTGAGLVNIRVKALYIMRSSIGSDDLSNLAQRAISKGWV